MIRSLVFKSLPVIQTNPLWHTGFRCFSVPHPPVNHMPRRKFVSKATIWIPDLFQSSLRAKSTDCTPANVRLSQHLHVWMCLFLTACLCLSLSLSATCGAYVAVRWGDQWRLALSSHEILTTGTLGSQYFEAQSCVKVSSLCPLRTPESSRFMQHSCNPSSATTL